MKKAVGVLSALFLAACGGSDPVADGNDTMATATVIPADGSISATIASLDDLDYYQVTIPAGGRVLRLQTFDSSGTTCASVDPYTDVYDTDGFWVGGDDDSGPAYCSDVSLTLAAGTYFVETGWAGWDPAPPWAYVLTLTTSAIAVGSSETESNDTIGTANGPYTADAHVSAAISPAGDVDYYAVENTSASPVTVNLATSTGAGVCTTIDTYLRVLSGGGTQLATNDDSGIDACSFLSYVIPASTTVYVEITDTWAGVIGYYELDINFL
jgi:hypothetical protein